MISERPIAYVYPKRYFFVAKDIAALQRSHVVLEHQFLHAHPLMIWRDFLLQLLFLLSARRKGVRHVIAHFAGHHTVLPVILGFRTHIIVAGSDACTFPGINYGSFRKRAMSWSITCSMLRAETILPVHASLASFRNDYSTLGPRDQGYASFISGLSTRSLTIPYGFDHAQWNGNISEEERNGLLCVAFGAKWNDPVHLRKGLDLILAAAVSLPQCAFTIVGVADLSSYSSVPTNVRIVGVVPPNELMALYGRHSIYLQPSVMEGFPNALCEAMLMGCVPIVSNMTSMPDIVGASGEVIVKRDPGLLQAAIERVLALAPNQLAERRIIARERIAKYTLEARTEQLKGLLTAS